MAIYRGSGGAGDATGDATNASQLALAAADEAQASATSAASSATSAAASASAAATSATDAATSETNAAGSAADALTSENAAASSASDAADSATAAAASASDASDDAASAATSATNAANSASSASTSASSASTSATNAATSATNASNSASAAATSETNAGNSATAAATSATNAAASASTASTQASNASTSATNAASSATAASSSASSASSSASSASTSATNAASSASSASSSASSASTSATSAASSASAAATSATNAANSATAAAASAAEAATFDPDLYLSKAGNLSGLANTVTAANNIGINPYGNGFKNRIINGAMMIDQRNAGASVTISASSTYSVDRFRSGAGRSGQSWGSGVLTAQQVADAPAGFYNSLKLTVSTADASIAATDGYTFVQAVEANNIADFNMGTANASPFVLSFWVKSSVAGTYACAIQSNGSTVYSYVITYTLVADTWTYVSAAIPAQTVNNTPPTGTTVGFYVQFDLGSGSNCNAPAANAWQSSQYSNVAGTTAWISNAAATMNITGVQLEKGSTATSFDYRPYGTELALCQRYYEVLNGQTIFSGNVTNGYVYYTTGSFVVTKRASPTMTVTGSGSGFPSTIGSAANTQGYQVYSTANATTSGAYYQISGNASSEL